MKITSRVVAVCVAVVCVACSPAAGPSIEIATIAGDWHAPGIELNISPEGSLFYKNTRGSSKTEMTGAAISGANTTGFDAGFFGLTSHFVINALPHDVNGVKFITIDGNELRARTIVTPPAADAPSLPPLAPLPPDTVLPAAGTLASLVGVWIGDGIRLEIAPDGQLDYERKGRTAREVHGASIATITASSFDMKMLGISSTFVMSAPPALVDGEVRMTIDEVVVTRQR